GHPLFVTRARDHLLTELDGRPPMEVLRALYDAASPRDRALMQSSLFLGIEMRPELSEYRRGDFLIRNLVGADPDDGALAVAASPARRARLGRGPRGAARPRPRRAAPGRPAARRAALLVPRARRRALRHPGSRQRGAAPPPGPAPARRLLLQRRDRPRRRSQLPARLHERPRDLPPALRDLSGARRAWRHRDLSRAPARVHRTRARPLPERVGDGAPATSARRRR